MTIYSAAQLSLDQFRVARSARSLTYVLYRDGETSLPRYTNLVAEIYSL